MMSTRTYRGPPREEAIAELRRGAGTQLDPVVVEALCDLLDEQAAAAANRLVDGPAAPPQH